MRPNGFNLTLFFMGAALWVSPALALLPAVKPGGVEEPNELFLPMDVGYDSAATSLVNYGASHSLIGLLFQPLNDGNQTQVSPPTGGGSATSFFDIFAEVTLDGQKYTCDGSVRVTITDPPATPEIFPLQIDDLFLDGGTLPAGTEIMLDPNQTSTGVETITPDGRGFMINSFFDVFTELSLDGGRTFTPGDTPIVVTGVPMPKSFWMGLGLMGMVGGYMFIRRKSAA